MRPCASEAGEPKPATGAGTLAAVCGLEQGPGAPAAVQLCVSEAGEPKPEAGAGKLAAVRPCASEASEPKPSAGDGTLAAMAGEGEQRRRSTSICL